MKCIFLSFMSNCPFPLIVYPSSTCRRHRSPDQVQRERRRSGTLHDLPVPEAGRLPVPVRTRGNVGRRVSVFFDIQRITAISLVHVSHGFALQSLALLDLTGETWLIRPSSVCYGLYQSLQDTDVLSILLFLCIYSLCLLVIFAD